MNICKKRTQFFGIFFGEFQFVKHVHSNESQFLVLLVNAVRRWFDVKVIFFAYPKHNVHAHIFYGEHTATSFIRYRLRYQTNDEICILEILPRIGTRMNAHSCPSVLRVFHIVVAKVNFSFFFKFCQRARKKR